MLVTAASVVLIGLCLGGLIVLGLEAAAGFGRHPHPQRPNVNNPRLTPQHRPKGDVPS